jgi:hypothetical protein
MHAVSDSPLLLLAGLGSLRGCLANWRAWRCYVNASCVIRSAVACNRDVCCKLRDAACNTATYGCVPGKQPLSSFARYHSCSGMLKTYYFYTYRDSSTP